MDFKRLVIFLLVLSLAGFAYKLQQPAPVFGHGSVFVPTGVILAPDSPKQLATAKPQSFAFLEANFTPLADFEFDARLISVAWYTDRDSQFSPVDLGVGWGRLSDSAIIDAMEWRHGSRFLSYRWVSQPPIPADEITRSMANIHIIPANAAVLGEISKLKIGHRIKGQGKLVEIQASDGYRWRSSIVRTDTGNGACEVLYLEYLDVL